MYSHTSFSATLFFRITEILSESDTSRNHIKKGQETTQKLN
jgi:hypothetical protein